MVVFFDIDGTIVDDGSQQIPQSAIRAVEKLRENGHIAIVNTGRPYSHIDPRVRSMAFRGWVCGCGMEVILDGAYLQKIRPDESLRTFAVEAVRRYHMKPLYETAQGGIIVEESSKENRWIREEACRMVKKNFPVQEIHGEEMPIFMKFVAFSEQDSDPAGFTREMEQRFTVIDRGNTMLELIPKGCSKAAGMKLALDYLGVDRSQTLAIGDSTNDLPMFSLAGHTVCMGGGMEQVKASAEFVTDTVLNDGIEKALRHYGLLSEA